MPAFDRQLIAPASADVEKAMAEAVDTANLRCRVGLMPVDRGAYRKFLEGEFKSAPEGVAIWWSDKGRVETFPPTPRGTLLGVAWRTTPVGQRVVRIAGRRIEPFNENPSNRFGPPWRQWPALCHLDDHVVTRTFVGGEPETIAMCGCGAIGPPEKLGWMVGRCGPCHDHIEEHGTPLSAGDGPPALRTKGQIIDVGFAPSGETVAGVEWMSLNEGVKVAVWDRRTGECRSEAVPPYSDRLIEPADGKAGVALSNGYHVFWAREAGKGPVRALPGPGSCVAHTFAGTMAVAVSYEGQGWRRELTGKGDWGPIWAERKRGRDIIYFSVALSPDGKKVALGRTQCFIDLFDWPGSEGVTLHPKLSEKEVERQRIYALTFSPDGSLLAAAAGRSGFVDDPSENWFGRSGGLYLYDVARGERVLALPTPDDDIIAVAFSPDGTLLFAGSTDCTIRVVDVATRKEAAVLSGHVGAVNALAFSPDGKLLASGGGDGLVRLWPWRQLLARQEERAAPRRRASKGRGAGRKSDDPPS